MTRLNEHHIGWWCPTCKNEHGLLPACFCGAKQIPVFAPLPTPIESTETRADMERHAEVVVCPVPDEPEHGLTFEGCYRLAPAHDQGPRGVGNGCGRWAVAEDDEIDLHGDESPFGRFTEADAVLWVVEGRKPGGAE